MSAQRHEHEGPVWNLIQV